MHGSDQFSDFQKSTFRTHQILQKRSAKRIHPKYRILNLFLTDFYLGLVFKASTPRPHK